MLQPPKYCINFVWYFTQTRFFSGQYWTRLDVFELIAKDFQVYVSCWDITMFRYLPYSTVNYSDKNGEIWEWKQKWNRQYVGKDFMMMWTTGKWRKSMWRINWKRTWTSMRQREEVCANSKWIARKSINGNKEDGKRRRLVGTRMRTGKRSKRCGFSFTKAPSRKREWMKNVGTEIVLWPLLSFAGISNSRLYMCLSADENKRTT